MIKDTFLPLGRPMVLIEACHLRFKRVPLHSEKASLHSEQGFLHSQKAFHDPVNACNVANLGPTVPAQYLTVLGFRQVIPAWRRETLPFSPRLRTQLKFGSPGPNSFNHKCT